ncbi:MAG TPA: POTRA domain-containing protein, partial [Pyrinomonadaceae bacterium]
MLGKISVSLRLCISILLLSLIVFAQNKYEDRAIQNVVITFEGADRSSSSAAEFEVIARERLGNTYSAVGIRNALDALYRTKDIISAKVEASEAGASAVDVRFIIKRKTRADKVSIVVGESIGDKVTEADLLLRVNLLNPDAAVTEQSLKNNADLILEYLRERGFFNAEVTYSQQQQRIETRVVVKFNVEPNAQARVETFNINIPGFDTAKAIKRLKLKTGELYSRERLNEDVARIKEELREQNFLAPEIEEPRVVFDNAKNTINITVAGRVGPTVKVTVDAEREEIGDKKQTELLPIKREGTVDFAAIIEGERRLENYYQEQGYFFADVTSVCSVNPQFTEEEASVTGNETEALCSALGGAELANRTVEVKYNVDLNRQLKLVDIRIEGTDQLTIEEIRTVLESQKANALGFIPLFGYGRGYTSARILEDDRATIRSLMRELGYRNAQVSVRQGVSPNGEDLIITFVVDEGAPTRIGDIDIEGNTAFSDAELQTQLPDLIGKNFSRARARNGVRKLAEFYSKAGFYDAKVSFALVERPKDAGGAQQETVKVVYKIDNEGRKVFINRILINGEEMTKPEAILKAINLRPDTVLRATDIFTSEQNLYATSAFRRVEIKVEPAGERADGNRLTDIIVNLEE